MSLHKQFGPEIRPYKIWIQLPNGNWILRREAGPRTRKTSKQTIRCIRNCTGTGGEAPVYERTTEQGTEIYQAEGRVLNISIGGEELLSTFLGGGPGGADNPITSYFPPITADINCEDYAPLQFKGGQELEQYIITMKAKGNIIDSLTGDIITTFNAEKSIECPGPIAGYAINQYATKLIGQRDLSLHGYYFDSLTGIKTVDKVFNLSLKEATGDMTIEGGQFEFQLTSSELVSIKRKDGIIEPDTDTTTGPPVCRIIISDNIGILLDVVVFGNPTINIQDPWGDITQQN